VTNARFDCAYDPLDRPIDLSANGGSSTVRAGYAVSGFPIVISWSSVIPAPTP